MKQQIRYTIQAAIMLIFILPSGSSILDVQAQSLERSTLWKVKGEGIETSYLFGTIHLISQADFELKPKAIRGLGEADQLVMELDLSDPQIKGSMMKQAQMKGGVTLESLLDRNTYQKLDKMLQESIGASVMFMNTFKPFIVSTFLIGRLIDGQEASFEMVLTQEAKKQGMPISQLESVEEQMAVFERIPYKSQAESLAEMINDEENMKKLFAEMVAAYRKEDITELYRFTLKQMDDSKQQDEILDKRNINWIPIMEKQMAEKSSFIAVGAAHLAGEKGLIQLLRKAGYTVTPVMD